MYQKYLMTFKKPMDSSCEDYVDLCITAACAEDIYGLNILGFSAFRCACKAIPRKTYYIEAKGDKEISQFEDMLDFLDPIFVHLPV